jgi:ribosomal protein S18 acetylase RimI-like enzyme
LTFVAGQLDRKPVGQIWGMATLPEYQSQGYGRHLLGQVLTDLKRYGFQGVGLLASPDGKPLYSKLGFSVITDNPIYQIGYYE